MRENVSYLFEELFLSLTFIIRLPRRDMERLFGVDAASLSWICLDCGNTCLEGNAKFVWMEHLAFIEGTITRLNAYLFAKKDIACFLCWSNKYRNLKLVRTETPSICLFTKIGRWKRNRERDNETQLHHLMLTLLLSKKREVSLKKWHRMFCRSCFESFYSLK